MTELRPCRTWDRLLWLDGLAIEKLSRPEETDEMVRCRQRIDAPERALETTQADPFVALFGFHDDLEKRRSRWGHLHPVAQQRRFPVKRLLAGLVVALLGAVVVFLFSPLMSFLGLLLIIPFLIVDDRPATDRAQLDVTTCPDCRYGLTGVPPAIPVDRAGLDSGPQACPECGCAWPLVPPPA